MILLLKIYTEGATHTFQLNPGDSILIGRADHADVKMPRPSVSQEHLKIVWSGTELCFEDLQSSNGSFRMPQDSPFVEARFPPKKNKLVLKLSKALVGFSWQAQEAQITQVLEATKTETSPIDISSGESFEEHMLTEFLASDAPELEAKKSPEILIKKDKINEEPINSSQNDISNLDSKVREDTRSKDKNTQANELSNEFSKKFRELRDQEETSDPHPTSAAWTASLAMSVVFFVISLIFGKFLLQGLMKASSEQLKNGGMIDVLIIFSGIILHRPIFIATLILALALISYFLIHKLHSPDFFITAKIQRALLKLGWKPVLLPKVLTFILLPSVLFWPLEWSAFYRVSPAKIWPAIQFWNFLRDGDLSANERAQKIRALLPQLEGSSLLYKHIFLLQRQRILQECRGIGDEVAWDDKKVCLILLSAVAIEALEEVRPALLGDIAARAAILLSLDGIGRVVAVEGQDSPLIPFFLGALDAVGLSEEKENIESMIQNPDKTQALATLLDLRKRVELRLDARQAELNLPKIFFITYPSPLEIGI